MNSRDVTIVLGTAILTLVGVSLWNRFRVESNQARAAKALSMARDAARTDRFSPLSPDTLRASQPFVTQ